MKKIGKVLLTLVIGFIVAMILMGISIYFGYYKAYSSGVEQYTVRLLGISIYQLERVGEEYTGTTIGLHMGIICGICMMISLAVREVISKLHNWKMH